MAVSGCLPAVVGFSKAVLELLELGLRPLAGIIGLTLRFGAAVVEVEVKGMEPVVELEVKGTEPVVPLGAAGPKGSLLTGAPGLGDVGGRSLRTGGGGLASTRAMGLSSTISTASPS